MPDRRTHISSQSAHGQLASALAALRLEHDVPTDFPSEAVAEAAQTTPGTPALDLRELPFVTLDPAGSRDLDQAFHLERQSGVRSGTGGSGRASGFTVRYAIADVPGFVHSGSALDLEARRRGQTLYLPDGAVPLHPPILSEGRASLLPGQDRTAYVWTMQLDPNGAQLDARVERALIRSRAQLDYASAQTSIDRGGLEEGDPLALLAEIGGLRIAQERARGGASLNLPEEEIVRDAHGYRIERRDSLPVEEWNAQLSLLAGMAAGNMMLDGRIGILRTMPAPTPDAIAAFRERVEALGAPWHTERSYGDYLRGLPRGTPQTAAILQAASALFRGADYVAFDGTLPQDPVQAAIAAPYAHVTAPLRRLVDRWGLAICASLCAGSEVPEWARASLPELPTLMRSSAQRASQVGGAALDRVEAALLRDRGGEEFDAIVLERRGAQARVQIVDPPVTANCPLPDEAGLHPAGSIVRVRAVSADVTSGRIELSLVG